MIAANEKAKARLTEQLAELQARRSRIADDLGEPADPDLAEQAIEIEDDEALEGQGSLLNQEIASVKRALDRLSAGTYGQCVRCGHEIGRPRLEARPEAALCIDCAQQAEK